MLHIYMSNRTWAIINTGLRSSLKPKCVNYASDHNYKIINTWSFIFGASLLNASRDTLWGFFTAMCNAPYIHACSFLKKVRTSGVTTQLCGEELVIWMKTVNWTGSASWLSGGFAWRNWDNMITGSSWKAREGEVTAHVSISRSTCGFRRILPPHGTEHSRINNLKTRRW